jgi:glucose/arabinose dehydrogenase
MSSLPSKISRRNSSYRPGIEILEDRLPPATLLPGFTQSTVTSGISNPTAMEFSPDGRLWVIEDAGNVKLVHNDGTTFTALQLNVDSAGDRGLLGIAFDPNFASNHYVYLHYTNPNPGTAPWATGVHDQISRFTVNDANPLQPTFTNEADILDLNTLTTTENHLGGAIHFGADGMLYVDTGDDGQSFIGPDGNSYRVSQTLANMLGKQLRIDVSKFNSGVAARDDTTVGDLIPADNPFVGQATGINQLIYVLGLRNPFDFAVQPGTGRILINDAGENSWEEVNDSIAGSNYGWSGGNTDGFGNPPPSFAPGVYRDPILAYTHSGSASLATGSAIVGGAFYNPATVQFPSSYVGKYFYGDWNYTTGWIRYFDPNHPNTAATPDGSSVAFATNTPPIIDLKVDAAGNLYYLADDGAVYKISYQAPPASQLLISGAGKSSVVAGTPFLVTAQAADQFGNPVTSYSGPSTVTVVSSPPDPQAKTPIAVTLDGSGFGFFLDNLKTAGSYTLTATAGSIQGTSSAITVAPAAAIYFKVATPSTATTGSSFSATVTALDAYGNVATSYSGKVHFTSSDSQAVLPTDTTLAGGMGTFNVTLDTAGNQTITATDTISAVPIIGGSSGTISTRGLTVTSFTPTATGFTATFSKPFVPSDLSLYGTSLHTFQAAALAGKNSGPITGTLLMDPTNENVTFKATGNFLSTFFGTPILPDDTYTVALLSGKGTHGFLDALGVGLDGANNGGHADYATTFTLTNAGKPILSIPDFARGPDGANTIKVPNNSAMGIPVTLSNVPAVSGVTDVVFTLTYNPTLLTPTGGGTGDSSGAGSAFVMGTSVSVDATHSTVTFSWHNGTAQSGTVVLGDILANVPNSAANQYEAKELLHCGSITVNSAAFTGVVADSLHVNAYFGDVTGDGKISGLDVATAGTVASGSSSGLAAYKLVDPGIIGDIAGDASIDATAVSDLASFTSNLPTPQIPAIPTGLTITPGGPDPTLSLAGGNGIVSVMLDDPHPAGSTGMEEAVLALTYDPKVLTVSSSDITLGSIPGLGSGWHLVSVLDQATGQIGIDLYSTTAISATQAGSLVNIAFQVLPGTVVPATAVQLVNAVTPSGRSFSTEVADAQGQYVLSPGMDRLVVETGSSLASQSPPRNAGNGISVPKTRGEVLLDPLGKHAEEVAKSRFPPPVNEANEVWAETFQIGTIPLLNTLLFQNSPRQLAADRLFLALARLEDAGAEAGTGVDGATTSDAIALDTVFAQID